MRGLDPNRAQWIKSSRSAANGHCVEIAVAPAAIAVRDSKDPDGPVLRFPRHQWSDFIRRLRAGQLAERDG